MQINKKSNLPLVSIIIPVYNGSNYLSQAINSALAQTYPNIEVLVINDGSNDNNATANIAKAYGNRIRYYEKENGGVSTALNYGIDKMEGEYFSWLSHDDMYAPDKIASSMELIMTEGVGVVVCNVIVIAENGRELKKNKISPVKLKSTKCFMALDTETGLNGCSLLVPKGGFDKCGKFNPELKCTQDYDMWFRLAKEYPFFHSENYGVLSRQHEEQDSKKKITLCTQEADRLHSRFLKNISLEEMQDFLKGDMEYLFRQYTIYRDAGYLKTAVQIFLHIFELENRFEKNTHLSEEILNEISGFKKKAENFLRMQKQILNYKKRKKAKNRIMFYSNVWTKGGIERVLSILMPELIDEYEIILVSNYVEQEEGFSLPEDVLHLKIDSQLNEKLPYGLLILATLLDVDIFVGNPNIIYTFLDVYELMEESGIRTIACNHGYYFIPYWAKWIYPVAEKRRDIYPKASAVTWLTTFSTRLGKNISDNSVWMPNPNTYPVQTDSVETKKDKIILAVGRFYDDIKRIDRILCVFREVLKKEPDAKLYLVGGVDLDMHVPFSSPYTIKELIQQLDFPDESSIVWVGEVNDVTKYYKQASILLLTSANEGFPMVLNEAGTFGVPQIIFEIPGLEDLVKNGENGYIVPQDDISGMAEKVCLLLENPDLLREMAVKAKDKAARFEKRLVAQRWKKLFALILNNDDNLTEKLEQEFPLNDKITMEALKDIVGAYQQQVSHITGKKIEKIPVIESKNVLNNIHFGEVPCTNCRQVIYESNSWRITKPLRWISLTLKSLKSNGLLITVKKIKRRFKLKFCKTSG